MRNDLITNSPCCCQTPHRAAQEVRRTDSTSHLGNPTSRATVHRFSPSPFGVLSRNYKITYQRIPYALLPNMPLPSRLRPQNGTKRYAFTPKWYGSHGAISV